MRCSLAMRTRPTPSLPSAQRLTLRPRVTHYPRADESARDGGKGFPELWVFRRSTRRHPHRLRGTDKTLCIACALSLARALGGPVTELLE